MPKSATYKSGTSCCVSGFQGSWSRTANDQHGGGFSARSLTVHWLHVLMQDVSAVTELKSYGNLVANLDYLAFREALATGISCILVWLSNRDLRSTTEHLNLPVENLAFVVVHEERKCISLSVELEPIMQDGNMWCSSQRPHVVIFVKCSFGVIDLYLFARDCLLTVRTHRLNICTCLCRVPAHYGAL